MCYFLVNCCPLVLHRLQTLWSIAVACGFLTEHDSKTPLLKAAPCESQTWTNQMDTYLKTYLHHLASTMLEGAKYTIGGERLSISSALNLITNCNNDMSGTICPLM